MSISIPPENVRDLFKGYRNVTLGNNGLMENFIFCSVKRKGAEVYSQPWQASKMDLFAEIRAIYKNN